MSWVLGISAKKQNTGPGLGPFSYLVGDGTAPRDRFDGTYCYHIMNGNDTIYPVGGSILPDTIDVLMFGGGGGGSGRREGAGGGAGELLIMTIPYFTVPKTAVDGARGLGAQRLPTNGASISWNGYVARGGGGAVNSFGGYAYSSLASPPPAFDGGGFVTDTGGGGAGYYGDGTNGYVDVFNWHGGDGGVGYLSFWYNGVGAYICNGGPGGGVGLSGDYTGILSGGRTASWGSGGGGALSTSSTAVGGNGGDGGVWLRYLSTNP